MAEISLNVQDSQSTINMIWSLNAIRLVKKRLDFRFQKLPLGLCLFQTSRTKNLKESAHFVEHNGIIKTQRVVFSAT